jgi:hypothetical protein
MEEEDIGYTPNDLGAKAERTHAIRPMVIPADAQAHHRDTPPRDDYVVEAGLLARGSSPSSVFPKLIASVT